MTTDPVSRSRPWPLDAAGILGLIVLVAAVALAVAWPWLPHPGPGGPVLGRYAPLVDGRSALAVRRGEDGGVTGWESHNLKLILSGRAIATDLRPAQRDAIEKFYRAPGEAALSEAEFLARLAGAQVYEWRVRELDAEGVPSDWTSLYLREARGDFLVAVYYPADDTDLAFDPPLPAMPSDLGPGREWRGEGKLSNGLAYEYHARVIDTGPFESALGGFDDCLQVETRLAFFQDGLTIGDNRSHDWTCAGMGLVDSQRLDAEGRPSTHWIQIAADGFPARPDGLPPAARLLDEANPLTDPAGWTLARLGRSRTAAANAESTIPPVWIPTDPPLVLAAAHGGDLVAFDAGDPTGVVRWRFHPGGTVFGPPAFDAEGSRIYFGASDKRLYALNAQGLFLWSFKTGDNVATRPVVARGTVVFGSEDRNVYALDAATGALRWRAATGGSVVSSPALAAETLVVIGSDDGGVYGLDLETGERRWLFATDGAVEAPIVVEDGVAYAASRDNHLYALDPDTGEPLWTARVGGVLRSAPAVGETRLFVVDDDGFVSAFARADGKRLWTSADDHFAGAPIIAGDSLLVADDRGAVVRMDFDGERLGEWPVLESGQAVTLRLGLTAGGGAAWLADAQSAVRRLGPGLEGPAPLTLAWVDTLATPPFDSFILHSAPVNYRDQAAIVDDSRSVYLVDPATGQASRVGQFGDSGTVRIEPVVAGDTLLAQAGGSLHAFDLAGARTRWSVAAGGSSLRPVTVAGQGVVLWLTGGPGEGAGTLHALDLSNGQVRWQARVEGAPYAGGTVVRDGTLYLSTPPSAYDLATGERLWQAEAGGTALGGPALSESGEALFVGLVDEQGTGSVVALNSSDGTTRWRAELGQDVLSPLERLWSAGEALIVPSLGGTGHVIALDAANGAELWRHEPAEARFGAITVADGRVWFGLQNGQVMALEARRGELAARYGDVMQALGDYSVAQRPAVIGDRVVVSIGLGLFGFEAPQ